MSFKQVGTRSDQFQLEVSDSNASDLGWVSSTSIKKNPSQDFTSHLVLVNSIYIYILVVTEAQLSPSLQYLSNHLKCLPSSLEKISQWKHIPYISHASVLRSSSKPTSHYVQAIALLNHVNTQSQPLVLFLNN